MQTQQINTGRTETIRALNDQLRTTRTGGQIVMTIGVNGLPDATQRDLFRALAAYNEFDADNDPHGEHDFGLLVVDGHEIMFKVDYFDNDLVYHSPDPADPSVTRRVMTLMLAEEY